MQMPKTAFEKVLQKAESIVKRLSVELQCVEHLFSQENCRQPMKWL